MEELSAAPRTVSAPRTGRIGSERRGPASSRSECYPSGGREYRAMAARQLGPRGEHSLPSTACCECLDRVLIFTRRQLEAVLGGTSITTTAVGRTCPTTRASALASLVPSPTSAPVVTQLRRRERRWPGSMRDAPALWTWPNGRPRGRRERDGCQQPMPACLRPGASPPILLGAV